MRSSLRLPNRHLADRTVVTLSFLDKARTLESVSAKLSTARVLPLIQFRVDDWRANRDRLLSDVEAKDWGGETLIVRSSARGEDGDDESFAGRFRTVGGVKGRASLTHAIEAVIASYGDRQHADDRVLVQPMLQDVRLSGVAFSEDPNTGSPYIVVNFQTGADTATVTGGCGSALRTAYVWPDGPAVLQPPLDAVVALTKELQRAFGGAPLDIEFAQDSKGSLWLFQVRPLVLRRAPAIERARHTALLGQIANKIDRANRPHPYLDGRRTVYGVMPDWNPAEIVGVRPRPLALSLYREIITDAIWAYQRNNYGYKNLRSFPLLVDFQGLPYIDVRVSFNSFVPADVPSELSTRLVDYYIERLLAAPALHDKVEFEIILTCYSFDVDRRLEVLREHGFSADDCELLKNSLNRLTNRIIHRETGLWRQDSERIETLIKRHALISASDLDTVSRIYWLLEDGKRYGTLPFAGLARAGFIAVQMLNSLVGIGVLSEDDRASFMAGLDTISSLMGRDFATLDRATFLRAYGHLRPGTYDILSPRYDESPELYFDWEQPRQGIPESGRRSFALSLPQMRMIERMLEEHRLEHDVVGLFGFLEAGIRGREYSKFVFTRSLSDALSLIGRLGAEHGFTLDDMSYLDIRALYSLYAGGSDLGEVIAESIERGRKAYARTQALVLPPLLVSGEDVWCFEMPSTEPNFVTQRRASGRVVRVEEDGDLAGTIVFISNADPGYDWIFSRGISGFVTAYGGANSHMAIRASELQLPAVIGAGEVMFQKWAQAEVLEIDAANRQVRIIR